MSMFAVMAESARDGKQPRSINSPVNEYAFGTRFSVFFSLANPAAFAR